MTPEDTGDNATPPDRGSARTEHEREELTDHEEGVAVRRGLSFAVVSFGVNGVLGLIGAVLTSRIYGVDVMGEYALVIAPWVVLITLSSVAERVALIKEIVGLQRRTPRVTGLFIPVLGFSFLLTLAVSIVVGTVTAIVFNGPAEQPQLVLPSFAVLLVYLIFDNTSLNLDGVLSAFRAGRELFIGRTVQILGFPVFALLLAQWEHSVTALTIATIAAMVVSLAVRLVLVRTYLTLRASWAAVREGLSDLPDLLRFSMKVMPAQLMGGLADQASTWVLSVFLPISAIGAWARSTTLAGRLNEAGWRITEILYATLARRHRDGDMEGFASVLSRTTRLTGVLIFLPASIAAGASTGILRVFGEGFDQAAGAFSILLFACGLGVVGMGLGQALVAAGFPHLISVVGVTRALVGLTLLVPGAVLWGTDGAALALLVAVVVETILSVRYLRNRISPLCLPSVPHTLSLATAAAAGFGMSRAVDLALPRFIGMLLALALGALSFGGIVWAGAVEPSERAMALSQVRQRLSRG